MDLTNLTLDELLAQIRADSGYKEPVKEEITEPVKEETVEIIEEPAVAEVTEEEPEAAAEPEIIDGPEEEQTAEIYEPEAFLSLEGEEAEETAEEEETVENAPVYYSEQPIEIIEGEEEETASLFEPQTFVYNPPAPPAPLEIIAEEETAQPEQTVYEPVTPAEEEKKATKGPRGRKRC